MSENDMPKWKSVMMDGKVKRLTLCLTQRQDPILTKHYAFESLGVSLCGVSVHEKTLLAMDPVSWANIKSQFDLASCADCRRIFWDMIGTVGGDIIYPDKDSVLVIDAANLYLLYSGGVK